MQRVPYLHAENHISLPVVVMRDSLDGSLIEYGSFVLFRIGNGLRGSQLLWQRLCRAVQQGKPHKKARIHRDN